MSNLRSPTPPTCRRFWLRLPAVCLAMLLVGPGAADVWGCQEEPLIPQRCHVWGGFQEGAWSRVNILVESTGESGEVALVKREVVRTLRESTDEHYTLHIQTTSENGKAPPQNSDQLRESRWYITAQDLIAGNSENLQREIKLLDRQIDCQVFEYRQGEDGAQTTHQDFFNANLFPYFFKRVVLKPSSLPDEPFQSTLEYEVIATDLPVHRGERLISAAETRTIVRTPESTTVIVELVSPDIPGGLIFKRTIERDKDGRLLRRESVELDDFGLRTEMAEEHPRRQLFRERRGSRPLRSRLEFDN